MSLFRIAFRSIQHRGIASTLTMLSMALGVMLVVAVLLTYGVVSDSFKNNSALGYNLIVGPKGGKLQLTLNTVYYLSQPIENLPYDYYLEFKRAGERPDGKNGKYSQFVSLAVPVLLGDYYGEYRVVGTNSQLFDELSIDPTTGEPIVEFAAGRNLQYESEEYGFYEAVVGATVAREMNIELGHQFSPSHGSEEGHTHAEDFTVVGILAPSGTPYDRAVFVNMEGFYLMEGHAKVIEEEGSTEADAAEAPAGDSNATADSETDPPEGKRINFGGIPLIAVDPEVESPGENGDEEASGDNTAPAERDGGAAPDSSEVSSETEASAAAPSVAASPARGRRTEPLPIDQREVTAILVRTINPLVTPGLSNTINEGVRGQAVLPIREIYNLFDLFVRPIQQILLALTAMICIVSGIGILVSIYNSMSDRRREIAIMRALGAGRGTVMAVVLLEAIMLALGGGCLGWVGGHLLIAAASDTIANQTGVTIGFFDFAPPIDVLEALTFGANNSGLMVSAELLLVPALLVLAIVVGLWPAITAYRTDIARSL